MVPETESLASQLTGRVILLCVTLIVSACSDDEPVAKPPSCNCPPVKDVSVSEQYQTPGNIYQRPAAAQARSSNPGYMRPSQTFSSAPQQQGGGSEGQYRFPAAQQQGWSSQGQYTVPAEPAGGVAQPTYEAPRYTASQTQRNTAATPWEVPEQSQGTVQQYQYGERPWGPQANSGPGKHSQFGKDTPRQQPKPYQWQPPVGGGYYGWGAGPYGVMPGAGYPGYR